MADQVAKGMSEAGAATVAHSPKKGDEYECSRCGMGIKVTADCRCDEPEHVHFECCGQAMDKK